MDYIKNFFVNTAILITLSYAANFIFKYTLTRASITIKRAGWIAIAIFAGWLSSFFGFRLEENIIFDLRFVPLMVSTLIFPHPFTLLIIGVGTGLMRLTFGIDAAAFAGVINLSVLGAVCALLAVWFRKAEEPVLVKGALVILSVNVANSLNIAVFGVIPLRMFVSDILPYTFPAGLLLSILFALIFRDFYYEQRRMLQLQEANTTLSRQTEELHDNKLELEEQARQLKAASQYKTEFLANMSHELKTPLNGIISLSQLIEEDASGVSREELAEYGGIIRRSGEDLLALINDILDMSKVEAGQLDVFMEEVNISEIPELVRDQFQLVARQKGLDFRISIQSGVPRAFVSDPRRLQQIVRNLLSNAFKFTHEGKVSLDIRKELLAYGTAGEQSWIVFDVTDTGDGIAADKQEIIFEAFRQADTSIARVYGGTGLGLSISRNLARLLGGFIVVDSVEGVGSSFALYLPLEPGGKD